MGTVHDKFPVDIEGQIIQHVVEGTQHSVVRAHCSGGEDLADIPSVFDVYGSIYTALNKNVDEHRKENIAKFFTQHLYKDCARSCTSVAVDKRRYHVGRGRRCHRCHRADFS